MSAKPIALVTGAAGFIGSHMVDLLLSRGFRVHGIDNLTGGRLENLAQHRGCADLVFEERDIRQLDAADPLFRNVQFVFHFAGIGDIVPSMERPTDYMETNVQGTVRVLEAARHAAAQKLVYAASSSCYGLAKQVPTSESAPIDTQYPYALSKYQGEMCVFHWGQVYGLPVNAIRIFNAYGPRSRTTGAYGAVFGVFLAQKLAGKPFTVVGDGTQGRDFVFVTDVARAFLAAAEVGEPGEYFNLGTGNPQSVNKLVDLLGGDVEYIPKRPGEPDVTWADTQKIRSQLGWEPEVSFEEGVATMVENIEHWRDAPVWDTDSIEQATKTWFKAFAK